MRRSLLASAAACLCLVAPLAGCGSSTKGGQSATNASQSPASKTITFLAAEYTPTTQALWQELIGRFEARYPGTHVKLEMANYNDLTQKVDTLVANQQQPDILNFNTFSSFAKDGLIYPAAQLVTPAELADFTPNFLANGTYKGTPYALPLGATDRPLFYNKDIFAKVGIAGPPTTWQQLRADAIRITKAGYIGYGLPLGAEEAQGEWSIWMWNNGGDWKSASTWTINSPQNLQTLEFLNTLAKADKVTEANPGYTDRTSGVWRLFADGKVGMVMGASVTLPQMLQQNPSMHFGIAPPPTNGGRSPVALGVEDYLLAFKKANDQNLQTVREFLSFFYTPSNYLGVTSKIGGLPATRSGIAALQSNPAFEPYLKYLAGARFYPSGDPAWPAIQAAVQHQIGLGVETQPPASVLGQLQQTAQQAESAQG